MEGGDTERNQTVPVFFCLIFQATFHHFGTENQGSERLSHLQRHTAQLGRNSVPTGSQTRGGAKLGLHHTAREGREGKRDDISPFV